MCCNHRHHHHRAVDGSEEMRAAALVTHRFFKRELKGYRFGGQASRLGRFACMFMRAGRAIFFRCRNVFRRDLCAGGQASGTCCWCCWCCEYPGLLEYVTVVDDCRQIANMADGHTGMGTNKTSPLYWGAHCRRTCFLCSGLRVGILHSFFP